MGNGNIPEGTPSGTNNTIDSSEGNGGTSSAHSNGDRKDRNSGGRGRGRGRARERGKKGFGSNNRGGRQKKNDMGRGEWSRNDLDRRQRNDEEQAAKRRKIEEGGTVPSAGVEFSKEEIEAEARKPKRKVAVMIGYAGTGYKGMQINGAERTIEGDLFKAFIAAGAISKANADDPKKSSLVRCARTDKGVHAAGNMISLKLIVEEPDTVQKINENLPPQIRVWGIERTNGSFSCYQTCDSRWYEYLIPTYCFLPPHPQSFLAKQLVDSSEKEGLAETYKSLQEDVATFWEAAEEQYVKPILNKLDKQVQDAVMSTVHKSEEEQDTKNNSDPPAGVAAEEEEAGQPPVQVNTEVGDFVLVEKEAEEASKSILSPLDVAVKEVKAAYITAKKAYRISQERRERLQDVLNTYLGTRNFHNYTIHKHFSDPSSKRVVKSFKVGNDPIIINDTEWLSLKVHGQSFMMHQIRKMVAMAALVVRCASPMKIIEESYGPANISIPKAPGLGLLLERPVFGTYNTRAAKDYGREELHFTKFEKEMEEFKQREIYDRIFREEEKDHQFHTFFHHIDHHRTDHFLWVTASGIAAVKQSKTKQEDDASDDEAELDGEDG